MTTMMAHPATRIDAMFDELVHLPGMWRFEDIKYNRRHPSWWVTAFHPTGPNMAIGVTGSGPTISQAIADLYARMGDNDRRNGR